MAFDAEIARTGRPRLTSTMPSRTIPGTAPTLITNPVASRAWCPPRRPSRTSICSSVQKRDAIHSSFRRLTRVVPSPSSFPHIHLLFHSGTRCHLPVRPSRAGPHSSPIQLAHPLLALCRPTTVEHTMLASPLPQPFPLHASPLLLSLRFVCLSVLKRLTGGLQVQRLLSVCLVPL